LPATSDTVHVLDVQLDDAWAAIRAVGANGHRSLPILLPRVAPRRTPAVEP
jgi:hypothetical protein